MAKQIDTKQVIDIIVRHYERSDTVNVAILGGSVDFVEVYKILDRARLFVQDQEREMLIQKINLELTKPKEVQDV